MSSARPEQETLSPPLREFSEPSVVLEAIRQSPPVLAMAGVSENSRYHGGVGEESVARHTELVRGNVSLLIEGRWDIFSGLHPLRRGLRSYFQTSLLTDSSFTLADFHVAFADVHDIGKAVHGGLTYHEDGTTSSEGHEALSAAELPRVFDHIHGLGVRTSPFFEESLTFLTAKHGILYPHILSEDPTAVKFDDFRERIRREFEANGVENPYFQVAILVNVVADLASGRKDQAGFEGQQVGFSQRQQETAKFLLAEHLAKLP